MTNDLQKRVEDLEREVKYLRTELETLKHASPLETQPIHIKQVVPAAKPEMLNTEKQSDAFEDIQTAIQTIKKQRDADKKPEKSFEEHVMWALPKIFMLILVLGILWGLKLMSDYGFLSDWLKIIATFILSIGLSVTAFVAEKKQAASSAIIMSLYGGSFIIGILTTAAGAIIYELLPLTIALAITLLYIAYGITISYVKQNEVLTNFVAFTSLLLPYLLDYMDFNERIILIYVLILCSALQIVILKYQQRIALYVTSFLSIVAVEIIWGLSENAHLLFSIGLILLLAITIVSWWKLYVQATKYKPLHEGLLFSISSLSLLFIHFTAGNLAYPELVLLIVVLLFGYGAFQAYKHALHRVVDVLGTLAILTICNIILVLNLSQNLENILIPFSTFVGLMVALKLRATLMKVTYTLFFSLTSCVTMIMYDVKPFWSVDHFILFIQLIYIISAYVYAKRPKKSLNAFESFIQTHSIIDSVPIFISIYVLAYMYKIDTAYISTTGDIPYVVIQFIAVIMLASLFLDRRYIGRFLTYVYVPAFLLMSVLITPAVYNHFAAIGWLNVMTRGIYIAIQIALLADMYQKGLLYRKWLELLEKSRDRVISGFVVLITLSLVTVISQLHTMTILSYFFAIAAKTMILFLSASCALWLSLLQPIRSLRITGLSLLFIAIVKLIFFDLASLDLLVRAILFIAIGGIGFVLSNRLLKNKNE